MHVPCLKGYCDASVEKISISFSSPLTNCSCVFKRKFGTESWSSLSIVLLFMLKILSYMILFYRSGLENLVIFSMNWTESIFYYSFFLRFSSLYFLYSLTVLYFFILISTLSFVFALDNFIFRLSCTSYLFSWSSLYTSSRNFFFIAIDAYLKTGLLPNVFWYLELCFLRSWTGLRRIGSSSLFSECV